MEEEEGGNASNKHNTADDERQGGLFHLLGVVSHVS